MSIDAPTKEALKEKEEKRERLRQKIVKCLYDKEQLDRDWANDVAEMIMKEVEKEE